MVAVFITDVKSESLSHEILRGLEREYPQTSFHFDLEDFKKPYPCGHSILRMEAEQINTDSLTQHLTTKGVRCEFLKDTICG